METISPIVDVRDAMVEGAVVLVAALWWVLHCRAATGPSIASFCIRQRLDGTGAPGQGAASVDADVCLE